MPTKRYRRWRKVVAVRQRKLRKVVEDNDEEMMSIATGGPPKETGK
jgi:hypothetical protein